MPKTGLFFVLAVGLGVAARSQESMPSTILRPLYSVHGEVAGDQFGWLVVDLGDTDGDQAHDLVALDDDRPGLWIVQTRGPSALFA